MRSTASAQCRRVAIVKQIPRDTLIDQCRQSADVTRHDRRPARRRLESHETETLSPRGNERHVCGAHPRRELPVRLGRDEAHVVNDARFDRRVRAVAPTSLALRVPTARPRWRATRGRPRRRNSINVSRARSAPLSFWSRPTYSSRSDFSSSPSARRACGRYPGAK